MIVFQLVKCEAACAEFLDGDHPQAFPLAVDAREILKEPLTKWNHSQAAFFFSGRNAQQFRVESPTGFLRRRFEPCADRVNAWYFDQRSFPVLAIFTELARPVTNFHCFLAIKPFAGDLHFAPPAENSYTRIASNGARRYVDDGTLSARSDAYLNKNPVVYLDAR
jgi:hypothetical protein